MDILTLSEGRYLPADLNRLADSEEWLTLLDLLLDSRRIRDCLKATAPHLRDHPLLVLERESAAERQQSIDLLFEYDAPTAGTDAPSLE